MCSLVVHPANSKGTVKVSVAQVMASSRMGRAIQASFDVCRSAGVTSAPGETVTRTPGPGCAYAGREVEPSEITVDPRIIASACIGSHRKAIFFALVAFMAISLPAGRPDMPL